MPRKSVISMPLAWTVQRLNREGAAPLMPMLDKINSMKPEEFTSTLAGFITDLVEVFGTGVGADAKMLT